MSLSLPLRDPNGRQFSRDSFDRFGDDLTEVLLSYLLIKDKFRFECVSKQWRRLVFNKVIHFDDLSIRPYLSTNEELDVKFKSLKTVFKKCQNIQTIKFYVNSETVPLLSLLSDSCPRLKSIELVVTDNVTSESIRAFGQTLGSKVEAFEICHLSYFMSFDIEMLKWFPKLKRLSCQRYDWLNLVDNQLVPELIQLGRINVDGTQMSAFIRFVAKYKNTLKNITVHFHYNCNYDLVFQQLYRLNNLECLNIVRNSDNYLTRISSEEVNLTPKIIALGQCCPKLSKIHFHTLNATSMSPPLNPVTNIKSLSLYFLRIPNNFFANLSLLIPNLKELEISAHEPNYTNKDLIDLSAMKHLKRIVLSSFKRDHSVDDSAVIQLFDNCKQLKELKLKFKTNITVKTISKLKELANNRPKEWIRFSAETSTELRQTLTKMPNNLSIELKITVSTLLAALGTTNANFNCLFSCFDQNTGRD